MANRWNAALEQHLLDAYAVHGAQWTLISQLPEFVEAHKSAKAICVIFSIDLLMSVDI